MFVFRVLCCGIDNFWGDHGFRVLLRTLKLNYYSACYAVIFQVQCIRFL